MQAYRDLNHPFVKYIQPFIVRQLMQDNIVNILFRNIHAGQYDTRMKKAKQQRRRNQRVDAKLYRPFYAGPLRNSGQPV